MIQKTILFIPSNKNHVIIFTSLNEFLKENKIIFLTQDYYKNEGAEDELIKLGLEFKQLKNYQKIDPSFILEKENVGVVVIGNDIDIIPQWFVRCAKNLKIPTVLIQDGLLFNLKKKYILKNIFSQLKLSKLKLLLLESKLILKGDYNRITYGESNCDQIHVWGKPFQKYMEKKIKNKKQIINTGYLKNINQKYDEEKTNNEIIILYSPTELVKPGLIDLEEMEKNTKTLISTILSFNNLKLIIKPHPIEGTKFYEKFVRQHPDKILIKTSEFFTTLRKCSFLITNLSTTAIEALAIKKPVIIFLPQLNAIVDADQCHRDLISKNVILYANDKNSLEEQIKKIINKEFSLNDETLENILTDYLGTRNTESLRKSSQAIISLLNN